MPPDQNPSPSTPAAAATQTPQTPTPSVATTATPAVPQVPPAPSTSVAPAASAQSANPVANSAASSAVSAAGSAANAAVSVAGSAASAAANMAKSVASALPKLCKCQTVNAADWDKKKQVINKTFYKAFSPRIFYYPFSFVIDVFRAQKAAIAKNYKVVENGMVMDDGAMFLGNIFVEVTGANTNDPEVYSLEGKEAYTKVSRSPWMQIKNDILDLEKEMGKKPAQLFIWYTSCPACTLNKDIKAVLIALP